MTGVCFFICFSSFIIFLILFIIFYSVWSTKNSWGKFAIRTKLHFKRENWYSEPEVTGKYKNIDYRLYTFRRGKGRNMPAYTAIKMILSPCESICHLRIYRKGLFTEVNTVAELKEVETGDPLFDSVFTVKSKTPDKIYNILIPHIRNEMLKDKNLINITLDGTDLNFHKAGIIRNSQKLTYISEIMYLIACQVTGKQAEIEDKKPL